MGTMLLGRERVVTIWLGRERVGTMLLGREMGGYHVARESGYHVAMEAEITATTSQLASIIYVGSVETLSGLVKYPITSIHITMIMGFGSCWVSFHAWEGERVGTM